MFSDLILAHIGIHHLPFLTFSLWTSMAILKNPEVHKKDIACRHEQIPHRYHTWIKSSKEG